MRTWIICLLIAIVSAHVAMWISDTPRDLALRLTVINAAGWAIILLPAWAVSKWAAAQKER